MSRKQCKHGLDIYKKFVVRMDGVAKFLRVAEVTPGLCVTLRYTGGFNSACVVHVCVTYKVGAFSTSGLKMLKLRKEKVTEN